MACIPSSILYTAHCVQCTLYSTQSFVQHPQYVQHPLVWTQHLLVCTLHTLVCRCTPSYVIVHAHPRLYSTLLCTEPPHRYSTPSSIQHPFVGTAPPRLYAQHPLVFTQHPLVCTGLLVCTQHPLVCTLYSTPRLYWTLSSAHSTPSPVQHPLDRAGTNCQRTSEYEKQ